MRSVRVKYRHHCLALAGDDLAPELEKFEALVNRVASQEAKSAQDAFRLLHRQQDVGGLLSELRNGLIILFVELLEQILVRQLLSLHRLHAMRVKHLHDVVPALRLENLLHGGPELLAEGLLKQLGRLRENFRRAWGWTLNAALRQAAVI